MIFHKILKIMCIVLVEQGRCGNKGIAISFLQKADGKRAQKLISILKRLNQEIPAKLISYQQSSYSGGISYGQSRSRYRKVFIQTFNIFIYLL